MMEKFRTIVTWISFILYLLIIGLNIRVPYGFKNLLLAIILINKIIEEWEYYLETKINSTSSYPYQPL